MAFEGVSHLRTALYSSGILKTTTLSKPVVSVGNLTVGGTGKTPVVDVLLEQFKRAGKRACVLSRGYGSPGQWALEPIVVGQTTKTRDVGDEPAWLAQRHPESIVVVNGDRVKSAETVTKKCEAIDIFILDDGFQHEKIKKDYEIVLLDSTVPSWQYRPLPWGLARSPLSSLARADLVILTRVNQVSFEKKRELEKLAMAGGAKKIIGCGLQFLDCVDVWTKTKVALKDKKVFIVSAIGNPESFKKTCFELKLNIVGEKRFSDHSTYTDSIFEMILKEAKSLSADIILLTEKDGVKVSELKSLKDTQIQCAILKMGLEFERDIPQVYDLVSRNFS
jgi:tetraacyldisaccharide 4'-kinase